MIVRKNSNLDFAYINGSSFRNADFTNSSFLIDFSTKDAFNEVIKWLE